MPVCAVKLCRNYVGKMYNNTKITFHRFPTDPELADRWRSVIQRSRNEDYWKPHKTSVVCSDHFSDDDLYFTKKGLRRLKNGSVPSKCLFLLGTETECQKNIKQEASASNMVNDIENQIIEPKSSCSKEPCLLLLVTESESPTNIKEEPSASSIVNDIENQTIEPKPSCSKEPVGDDNECLFMSVTETQSPSNIKQEPSASNMVIDIQNQIIEPKPSGSNEPVSDDNELTQDFSDLESIFDTPTEAKLRRTLRRKITLERKHRATINALRKQNIRLKKRNIAFKSIINTLKKQKSIKEDVNKVLEGNLFAANLYSLMSKKVKGKGKRPAKYSPEFRKFCLTLHSLSPRAYSFVRRNFETCLPHPKTLPKWHCNIDGSPLLDVHEHIEKENL